VWGVRGCAAGLGVFLISLDCSDICKVQGWGFFFNPTSASPCVSPAGIAPGLF